MALAMPVSPVNYTPPGTNNISPTARSVGVRTVPPPWSRSYEAATGASNLPPRPAIRSPGYTPRSLPRTGSAGPNTALGKGSLGQAAPRLNTGGLAPSRATLPKGLPNPPRMSGARPAAVARGVGGSSTAAKLAGPIAAGAIGAVSTYANGGSWQESVGAGIGGGVGAYAGGQLGAAVGFALGGPVGAVAGGVAGATAGAMAGSAIGQAIGDFFDGPETEPGYDGTVETPAVTDWQFDWPSGASHFGTSRITARWLVWDRPNINTEATQQPGSQFTLSKTGRLVGFSYTPASKPIKGVVYNSANGATAATVTWRLSDGSSDTDGEGFYNAVLEVLSVVFDPNSGPDISPSAQRAPTPAFTQQMGSIPKGSPLNKPADIGAPGLQPAPLPAPIPTGDPTTAPPAVEPETEGDPATEPGSQPRPGGVPGAFPWLVPAVAPAARGGRSAGSSGLTTLPRTEVKDATKNELTPPGEPPKPPRINIPNPCGCNVPLLQGQERMQKQLEEIAGKPAPSTAQPQPPIAEGVNLVAILQKLNEMQGWAEKAWQATRLQKVIDLVVLIGVLHNVAILSKDVAETFGYVVSQALQIVGIKDEEGNPLDVNSIVGGSLTTFAKNVLGEDVYNDARDAYRKANRVIQVGSAIVWTVRSMQDAGLDLLEWVGSNTGRIGNALKRFGVVGENAYPWMSQNPRARNRIRDRMQGVFDGVEQLDDTASSFAQVTGNVVEIQEEFNQFQQYKNEFLTEVTTGLGSEAPEHQAIAQEAIAQKATSEAPDIPVADSQQGQSNP